jgi:teichuronic acid exporter
MGQQGIQFVITIILARLLSPEEFGLIAMLTIFILLAQSFIDSGFGQALIQKKFTTNVDESSIFFFNIVLGILAAGVLYCLASWIAAFYKQPILIPMTRVLSLNLIINSFGLIHTTLLTKRLDFKTQMKVSLIATVFSGIVGVIMAYRGLGAWSLIAQLLINSMVRTVLLWFFHSWRPAWVFSCKSLRDMFSFGSKLLLSGILNTIFDNIYLIAIGKLFSATDLGYYSRAQGLQKLPVNSISVTVGNIAFSVFSSLQDDAAKLKRGCRKALTMILMINTPLMIGLAVVAKPLVLVLLTDKWAPCTPYLRLLCVVGILFPIHLINLNVLSSQGRSDIFLRLEILKKVMVVIAIVVTYRVGISAMILGQIVTSCLSVFINTYYTGMLAKYPFTEQVRDFLPSFVLASVMGVGISLLSYVPFPNQVALLGTQITVGVLIYLALCCLFKLSSFEEALQVVQAQLTKFRQVGQDC